jgi:hypothetical protein
MRTKIASIIALGVMLSASVAASTFDLDVDDDGETTALTDGLLVIRYLFDFSGDALVAGAVSEDAARDTPDEIEAYLETNKIQLDVDGDGEATALTDGLLIIRSLFGFAGDSLIAGAIGNAASRGEAVAVQRYLETILDSDNDGVVDSRDGFPNISLGGRKDSDGDGYPDECDEACVASGLTKDLETIAETTAPSTTTPITPTTSPPSSGSGTFIWDTHNWDEQTWQ